MMGKKCSFVLYLGMSVVVLAGGAAGAEWAAYKCDAARSGVTNEALTVPMKKVWVYEPTQAPRPAWPEPGKELHRLDFDYAFQPVVVGGLIYFGSSTDDTLRALDAETGELRWRFTTGGPIRFAPVIADGRLYVVSDDGSCYALDAGTGRLLWKFRGAPGDEQMLGNGRMISRWPCRSGVIAVDGRVYFSAGMWPSHGIYVYALDARTGKVLWCNDTSGDMYRNQPHRGASAFTGVCPQGYMLASKDLLLIPSGRTTPGAYDRKTGRLVYYQPHLSAPLAGKVRVSQGNGGWWALIADDIFFNPRHSGGAPDIDVHVGESEPRRGDGLTGYALATGLGELHLPNKHRALVHQDILYAVGNGELDAIDLKTWRAKGALEGCVKWTASHPRAYSLALAGGMLLVGGRDSLTAFDTADGRQVWDEQVEGQVRGIAVAGGRIFASTNRGTIVSFEPREVSVPAVSVREELTWQLDLHRKQISRAAAVVRASRVLQGYALVVGEDDSRLATALASQTDLHVISLLRGRGKADAERERLLTCDLYGSRISVQERESYARLPFAPYFADLIVVSGDVGELSGKELYRVLRPCGGVLYFPGVNPATSARLIAEARLPAREIRFVDGSHMVLRGALPGAGEWRRQWADGGKTGIGEESRARPPFDILWFGGPGPDRMMSRHWGTSTPLSVRGRVFITGQHHVIAFDAYNGRELWCRPMQGVGRRGAMWRAANFVADDDSVYVTIGPSCHRLDQVTGKTLAVYHLPSIGGGEEPVAPRPERPQVNVKWPTVWQVCGPFAKDAAPLPEKLLKDVPNEVTVGEKTYATKPLRIVDGMLDFSYLYGGYGRKPLKPGEEPGRKGYKDNVSDWDSVKRFAYAFAKIDCAEAGVLTIGAGADWWMQWFLDGKPIFDTLARGNGTDTIAASDHVFSTEVNAGEHVLAVRVQAGSAGWCLSSAGGAKYARSLRVTPPEERRARWGYLSVAGDVLLGTRLEKGTPPGSAEGTVVFALDKNDASVRWSYHPQQIVPSTGVAFGDGRLFLLDVTSRREIDRRRRRGEDPVAKQMLVALALKTGAELWRTDEVPEALRHVQCARGVVLLNANAAYDARNGYKLWEREVRPGRAPVIHGDWLIAGRRAYDLHTGQPRMTTDIVTGERRPWGFTRAYGCGPVAGSRKLLFFRSGTAGFFDFDIDGTTTFGGVRPGCSLTMIAANGLMILPEGSSGCSCSYNYQTSLALVPSAGRREVWHVFDGQRSETPPKHVKVNFGAPGDRRDRKRTSWLAFPRPVVSSACPVPLKVLDSEVEWYYQRTDRAGVKGTDRPWIYASGLRGKSRVLIDLVPVRPVIVPACGKAPVVDGTLEEVCWKNARAIPFADDAHLKEPELSFYACRDADNLYFAFVRKVVVRDGEPVPFTANHPNKDDPDATQDDSVAVSLTDEKRGTALTFSVTGAGGASDSRRVVTGGNGPDLTWDGNWTSAVAKDERVWTTEIAIPLRTLTDEKIDVASLQMNCMSRDVSVGGRGREVTLTPPLAAFARCRSFAPVLDKSVAAPERTFTVRLHFAEPGTARLGQRLFDVAIQGRTVLKDFDILKETGETNRALVKEFKGVAARETLNIELTPKAGRAAPASAAAPVLCGVEIEEERK